MMQQEQQANNKDDWKQKKGWTSTFFLAGVLGLCCVGVLYSGSTTESNSRMGKRSTTNLIRSDLGRKDYCALVLEGGDCFDEGNACAADSTCAAGQLVACLGCGCFPTKKCVINCVANSAPTNAGAKLASCTGYP